MANFWISFPGQLRTSSCVFFVASYRGWKKSGEPVDQTYSKICVYKHIIIQYYTHTYPTSLRRVWYQSQLIIAGFLNHPPHHRRLYHCSETNEPLCWPFRSSAGGKLAQIHEFMEWATAVETPQTCNNNMSQKDQADQTWDFCLDKGGEAHIEKRRLSWAKIWLCKNFKLICQAMKTSWFNR